MSDTSPVIELSLPTDALNLRRYLRYESYVLPFVTAALMLADIAIAVGSFCLGYWVRQQDPLFFRPAGSWLPVDVTWAFRPYFSVLLFVPMIRLFTLRRYELYQLRGEVSALQDVHNILRATLIGSLAITCVAFFYRGGLEFREFSYSRLVFFYDWLIALGGYTILRLLVRGVQDVIRRYDINLIPALVVGCNQNTEVCISEINENPRLGYRVIGVLAVEGEATITQVAGKAVLGKFEDLPALVRQLGIKEVLITDDRISSQSIFEAMMRCGRQHHVDFRVFPNLLNCLPRKTGIDQIGSLPMIHLFEEPLNGPNHWIKRGLDLSLASLMILLSAPLWLLIAAIIKLTSAGPAIYAQERVGMDGRVFRMYKFRSMYANADDESHRVVMQQNIVGNAVTAVSPSARLSKLPALATLTNQDSREPDTSEPPIYGKVKNDQRITPFGAWLRRYSLDELPQFLNVLRGEMSLVGPRPPIPYEVECYQDWHRARFHVKPGVTGMWQVSGRNRLNFEQMVRLDIYYIENWSVWLDLKILLKTLPVALRGDNAY
jgi:exopolysaccharide biosynthesis polyprenyl glycosylphosphotransferase